MQKQDVWKCRVFSCYSRLHEPPGTKEPANAEFLLYWKPMDMIWSRRRYFTAQLNLPLVSPVLYMCTILIVILLFGLYFFLLSVILFLQCLFSASREQVETRIFKLPRKRWRIQTIKHFFPLISPAPARWPRAIPEICSRSSTKNYVKHPYR